MLGDFLALTLKGLRYRPVRSWLTILGIIIGIMLVVVILALGNGIQAAVARTLQSFGSDLVIVLPGEETNPIVGYLGGQKFRDDDIMDLEKIDGVEYVVPMNVGTMNVEHAGEKKSVMVHAANWANYIKVLESSQGIRLAEGRWPPDDEKREVVLGSLTASSLFRRPARVGDDIVIKSKTFKVVGIMAPIGEQMIDNVSFISMDRFRDLTGASSGSSAALVRTDPGVSIDLVAQKIRFQLAQQEVVRDFAVLTPDKANRLVGNVLSIIELVLVVIALVSLLVGAVGIMNAMHTSVLERTKQIGAMKALGASDDQILSLFLIESGLIGLVGGVLGIVAGLLSAYAIGLAAAALGVKGLFTLASVDFSGLLALLVFTFVVGVLAGAMPARRAARLEPAEALRYE